MDWIANRTRVWEIGADTQSVRFAYFSQSLSLSQSLVHCAIPNIHHAHCTRQYDQCVLSTIERTEMDMRNDRTFDALHSAVCHRAFNPFNLYRAHYMCTYGALHAVQ